ncbi:hypothetical protein BB560_001120 [Smittium megazygosporum]|uniref:CBM1 domain-containing protein n=1 Tax=Smittium megazygosporum TaxID=133381 RepID=A0A2T9ZIG7_9FUNG|nr:hypothetical protein BB560_001120 [Smittium megazygosporum]
MKFLSILSVLSFVALGQSASIGGETLAKRQLDGSPCTDESKVACAIDFQHSYIQCVHGRWLTRDNPPADLKN